MLDAFKYKEKTYKKSKRKGFLNCQLQIEYVIEQSVNQYLFGAFPRLLLRGDDTVACVLLYICFSATSKNAFVYLIWLLLIVCLFVPFWIFRVLELRLVAYWSEVMS